MQLTYEEKLRIVNLRETGLKVKDIVKKTGIQQRTVYRILKQQKERGTIRRQRGSGRPKTFDERGIRHLLKVINKDRRLTLNEIIAAIPEDCCEYTVSRILHEEGYSKEWL